MSPMVVNMHDAKSGLSRLVKRAEKGERITIARAGRPVAQLVPVRKQTRHLLPAGDPLRNLDSFAVSGPGGKLTNEDIDRTLYGSA
jgi:prevent-host-death family protein